jgi:hypothetical protein
LRDLRLELDAWQSLLRDDFRREGDEHAASAAQSSPTQPLHSRQPAGADRSVRGTTLLLLVSVLLARRRWPSSLRLRQATKITPDHLARGAFADAACMRLAT